MALVYSYVRFSTKKQLDGDSLRRQVKEGDAWIRRNGHTLANTQLHDLGRSGFHGRHLKGPNAKLGEFLRMIESGRAKPGNILLVENLDRLSREGMRPAEELFKKIIDAGVLIAVLKPYERVYDKTALETPFAFIEPLMAFHLAYLESKNKSDRLKSLWEEKRREAVEEGKKFNTRSPSWIDFKNKDFNLNSGKHAIHFIFEATASGIGQRKLLTLLVEKFAPIGTSGNWNTSFIQAVLNDRAVLGHLQPMMNEDGRRVPVGPEIPNYYPAVITEDLWDRAQAAKANNLRAKGPHGKFVNLVTGSVFNASDGHPMHLQRTKNNSVQRRFASYGHIRKLPGSCEISTDYYDFETHLLTHLSELNPEDLKSNLAVSELRAKEQELQGVENNLKRLERDLADVDAEEYETLKGAARIATRRRDDVKKEVERIKTEMNADVPLNNVQQLVAILQNTQGEELHTIRLRLRALIAELVESIYIKPEKHLGRVYTMVQVNYKQGMVRQYGYGPGWTTTRSEKVKCRSHFVFTFDLRDVESCKESYLQDVVALVHRPAEKPVFDKVPKKLKEAGDLWLKIRKSELDKASFRTIPSKIRRFVAYVGEGSKTASVTEKDLSLYKRVLVQQVRERKAKKTQARVEINRIKEFLRWLFAQGAVKEFDISESAVKAIP